MFPIKTLAEEIARRSSGRLTSLMLSGAEDVSVTGFAPLEKAAAEHVAFIAQPRLREALKDSRAGVVVMREADRAAIDEFLAMPEYIDVTIPGEAIYSPE